VDFVSPSVVPSFFSFPSLLLTFSFVAFYSSSSSGDGLAHTEAMVDPTTGIAVSFLEVDLDSFRRVSVFSSHTFYFPLSRSSEELNFSMDQGTWALERSGLSSSERSTLGSSEDSKKRERFRLLLFRGVGIVQKILILLLSLDSV